MDVPDLAFIIEDRVHDDLIIFHEAAESLRYARGESNRTRTELFRLGALVFTETRIPIVTIRDVDFVHEWGPVFGWTGIAFYPEPNNINVHGNLALDEITELCADLGFNLWTPDGDHEEAIQRAHNRLQQFENAWAPYQVATQAIPQLLTVYEHAAAPLMKSEAIPVVLPCHLTLARALRTQFGWTGNAIYPRSNNIRQFYGVLTRLEAADMEDVLVGAANNMRFPIRLL